MRLQQAIIPLMAAGSALGKTMNGAKVRNKEIAVDSGIKGEGNDNSNRYLPLMTALIAGGVAVGAYLCRNHDQRDDVLPEAADLNPNQDQDLLDAMNQRDERALGQWNQMIALAQAGDDAGAAAVLGQMFHDDRIANQGYMGIINREDEED